METGKVQGKSKLSQAMGNFSTGDAQVRRSIHLKEKLVNTSQRKGR